MIDFKKLDRADLWIASDPLTPEQQKAFSKFLKERQEKKDRVNEGRSSLERSISRKKMISGSH
jgi:hypothetical protein